MATRSRAPKPAGKRVLSSAVQGERAAPLWGGEDLEQWKG